jgi:hypothetical protein
MRIEDQMWLDHGSESFLAQVIGLVKIEQLSLNFEANLDPPHRVCAEFEYADRNTGETYRIVEFGHSYGEALRRVYEELRTRIGQ